MQFFELEFIDFIHIFSINVFFSPIYFWMYLLLSMSPKFLEF